MAAAVDVAEHAADCECVRCAMRAWADEPVEVDVPTRDPSERRRLALASDLLAAWAAHASGNPIPTDEALADLLIDASRARGRSAVRLWVALAGGALARAQSHHR